MATAMMDRPFRSSFPATEDPGFRTAAWHGGVPKRGEPLKLLATSWWQALGIAAKEGSRAGISLLSEDGRRVVDTKSFAVLMRLAEAAAVGLQERGVLGGERVLLVLPASFEMAALVFGVLRLGAQVVPVAPPGLTETREAALERIAKVTELTQASVLVTTKELRLALTPITQRVASLSRVSTVESLVETSATGHAGSQLPALETLDSGNVAFVMVASGTARGVMLSHENLLSNVHAVGQALRVNRNDRQVSWLPWHDPLGLFGALLFSVYWCTPLFVLPTLSSVRRPGNWLRAIASQRASLSIAPNFAYARAAVEPEVDAELDLSSWRLAIHGGERSSARTMGAFAERYAASGFREQAARPLYGVMETGLAVTVPALDEACAVASLDVAELARGRVKPSSGEGARSVVSVGRAIPGHEVIVVDVDGDELADGEIGHVVVAGPSVMKGYLGDPRGSAQVLQGGWLWTGDLGFNHGGHITVTGSVRDLLVVRGKNYDAGLVEQAARAGQGGATDEAQVAFTVFDEQRQRDEVVVVCETASPSPSLAESVSRQIAERTGLVVDEIVLAAPGSVPRTFRGEPRRGLTRERYLTGSLRPDTGAAGFGQIFARGAAGLMRLLGGQRARRG